MSDVTGDMGTIIGRVLGPDAMDQFTRATARSDEKAHPVLPNPAPELDFSEATDTLAMASRSLKDRLLRKAPTGPAATIQIPPPSETQEAEAHRQDLQDGPSANPKGVSTTRKEAAKPDPELPLIRPTPELVKLLHEGAIEEFNAQRPAGRLDLTGFTLSRRNLTGIDLRYCELSRTDLSGTDLTNARLQHAQLDRAMLEGCTLTNAQLYHAKLARCGLQKVVDARGAQFAGADLRFSDMSNSNFDGAIFDDAGMSMANLTRSTFREASMARATIARAVLDRAAFDGALLSEARLYQARGRDVSFVGAILVGAEAVESQLTSSNQKIEEAKVLATSFDGAWIQDFVHNGAINSELLARAHQTGLPPEGLLPKTAAIEQGKVLIDGIPGTDKVLYDAAMEDLNSLIGLTAFKAMIPELLSHLKVSLARERMGLPGFERKLHYALVGPPGVGKTTCSRILGKLFRSMGLLPEGQVIETDKSGFIAPYAGQTLGKTNQLIDDALGGALIADEIYALTESKNDDYAKDALVVLVKRLWDDRNKFAAFFLGYPKPMQDFIAANPGFDRRLAGIIELPPNTSGELVDIFRAKMSKLAIRHSPEMLAQVSVVMALHKEIKQEKFGNAGTVENFVEDLSKRMSQRLDRHASLKDKDALTSASIEDLPIEKYAKIPADKLPALKELHWLSDDGKAYRLADLPQEGPFPDLSPDSEALVRGLVMKYGLVDINTKH